MSATQPIFLTVPPRSWRELVLPNEHGSWAFAFEPIALGLLIAPSAAGGWLALALASAFFARRALIGCSAVAAFAFVPAALLAAAAWPR